MADRILPHVQRDSGLMSGFSRGQRSVAHARRLRPEGNEVEPPDPGWLTASGKLKLIDPKVNLGITKSTPLDFPNRRRN